MKTGNTSIKDTPIPNPQKGTALVQTAFSLVSAGTEKTLVEFAEKNIVGKAASRPDLVRQVIDKAKREGVASTIASAFNRLDQPMFPGYSSAGTIVGLGEDMKGFQVGDRVACGGGNHAVHAEFCTVPRNLLVKLPDEVSFEEAAFTTLGSVAMHGFRLSSPQLGESILVIGLGLLGLMEVQIVKASGCSVLGMDISNEKVALAKSLGVDACLHDDVIQKAAAITNGRGFDHVLICAGSKSNDSVTLAASLCRDRGNVVAIGAVGLDIPRKLYYEKEIQLIVSRSYGPGRYDQNYEEKGQDYPIGYVRWTEGRNMESFVSLIADGKMNVKKLITHRIPIEEGKTAYDLITGKVNEPFLGVLLQYNDKAELPKDKAVTLHEPKHPHTENEVTVGVLGAGNYANATFLPAMTALKEDVRLVEIASGSGGHARAAAEKFNFEKAAASGSDILNDPSINTVVLLTPHSLHASQIKTAIENNKNTYCEKPVALTLESLREVISAISINPDPVFVVGYNRRFAPLSVRMKAFFSGTEEPFALHYTMNAGYIPSSHWTQDSAIGGGRILGEACHLVDFMIFLTGAIPVSVNALALPDIGRYNEDNMSIQIKFSDGSVGTISYLANGDKSCAKERCEAFSGGKIAILNDFRTLETWSDGHHEKITSTKMDKGHAESWETFIKAIRGKGARPIPANEIFSGALCCFSAIKSARENDSIIVPSIEAFMSSSIQTNEQTD